MSTGAALQAQAARSRPASGSNHAGLLLQRKCACGAPTSSFTDKCARCRSTKRLQARLSIGSSHDPLEQEADRVADRVMDSSLAVTDESGASSTFLAKVGVRIDPGRQGGLFALGSVGAGLAAGDGVAAATSAEVGVGLRATDFLDVQLVRETVSGEGGGDATYWLTLKLVAPQRVLKGHR